MGYQAPSLEELRKLAEGIDAEYKGENQQRRSFISLLKILTDMTQDSLPEVAEKIILGAAIFELESISGEYRFKLPESSKAYSLLRDKLKISSSNKLADHERLVYMYEFYRNVPRLFEPTLTTLKANQSDLIWPSRDSLLKAIHFKLAVTKKRDMPRINHLVHATPELDALRTNTINLCKDYQKIAHAKKSRNAVRDKEVNFMEFVHHSCDTYYPEEYKKIPELYQMEHHIRRGAILFVLMEINESYKNYWTSPEGGWVMSGSNLYRDSLQALNIEHLEDMPAAEKVDLLKALTVHLEKIAKSRDYNDFLNQLKGKGISFLPADRDEILKSVKAYLDAQEIKKHQPQGRAAAVSTATSYAAQSTATYALQHGAGSLFMKGAFGAMAASLGGFTVVAIYAGGALVLTGLEKILGKELISTATASLFGWLLEKVGDSIGAKTAGVFSYQYSVSNEGIAELRKQLNQEDEKQFCAWVNTLLGLPVDIVSEKEKHNIRYVFALDAGCELLPLSHTRVGLHPN